VHDFLFVYGTLRSEFDNPYAQRLRSEARLVGRATVAGSIFLVAEYPGYRPHPPGKVHGELYRLLTPEATLNALDDYEGAEYRRVAIRVSTGESAWIYRFESRPPFGARIASGDFCAP
jgi:gamma-glutamylcyclotransferase (GGCT)/AIG2-like uncharacterized protein YtfP